ncbi:FUSC family protein [Bradyrhizobium sp.]|uniref:FUSC family protein n=1 Tax=Bradyrhizobium sp. TaxID=376 RepID=UPI003C3D0B75
MTKAMGQGGLSAPTLKSGMPSFLSFRFVWPSWASWAFALRTWIAMMAALYVAFWLQLQNAYSAAVCVGILALPTRGQAFEKALYRTAGTLLGFLAALVMAGLFNSTRDLFILAFAAWMGACGYIASFFDGNRAYGAVLSGYTAAIVALTNIDVPQSSFMTGVDRCAAILTGVLAIMVVNDLFDTPEILPGLSLQLEAAHGRIMAAARKMISDRSVDAGEPGDILKTIAGFRTEIAALRVESTDGRNRAGAARIAVAAMARQIAAMRIMAAALHGLNESADNRADAFLEQLDHAVANGEMPALSRDARDNESFIAASAASEFVAQSRRVTSSLDQMRTGGEVVHAPDLPRVLAREASFQNGLRLFLAVLIGCVLLILAGWPSLSNAMTMFSAIAGISVTSPSPQTFAKNAAIAMLTAIVLVGITEFLILDGADAFPMLALGWAPAIIGAGLLASSGNPKCAPVGSLMLVFMPLLLLPSNPQNYDPQMFLSTASLNIVSVVLLLVTVAVLLPTTDDRRQTWLLRTLGRDFRQALTEKMLPGNPDEVAFRNADRDYQIESLQQANLCHDTPDVRKMLCRSELTSLAWSMRLALQHDPGADEEGRVALATADPSRLSALAIRLRDRSGSVREHDIDRCNWAAALSARMAALIERSPNEIAALKTGF